MVEEETKTEQKDEGEKSPIEEARAEREALEKVRDEARAEREKLEKLKSDQLLSGTAGGYVKPEPAKSLTNREYAEKVDKGEINPWKV